MPNQLVADETADFSGGQDASKTPDRVPDDSYYAGINVTGQKADLSPRWGFVQKQLDFSQITTPLTLPTGFTRPFNEIFLSGKFQAYIPYPQGGEYYQLVVISGQIYLINQATFEVHIVPIAGGQPINEKADRITWTSAGNYLLIFDFPAYPVIMTQFTARRADPAKMECPPATQGTYNQNVVCIANAGNEWTASDPAATGFPEGPISFTLVETEGSDFFGQVFQLSTNYSNDSITAMGFLQVVDVSTGIGPLLIHTQNNIFSYMTQLPRADWELLDNALAGVVLVLFL